MRQSIPESVYDAALRNIAKDEFPDDGQVLEQWHGDRRPVMTRREIALEVIRQVAENGDGRRCVD